MKNNWLFVLSIIGSLSACSSGLDIEYHSSPQGARLICGEQFIGYTPRILNYNISEQDIQRGFVQTVPCQAVWMGGTVEHYRNQFPVNSNAHSYAVTAVSRNVTNEDIQFEGQRRAVALAQEQQNNQIIQSIGKNLPKRTYCNQYGSQVICNTY